MAHPLPFPPPLAPGALPTALAPMQDVTGLAFMRLLGRYGPPDVFFTEYFRVHPHSTLEPHILDAIRLHGTGRPVFAQLIGESRPHLRRSALELQAYPVAGIDLNLGCPAPKVCRKNVGGGLLRAPAAVDGILAELRACITGRLTVKMRVGFEDARHFAALLELINRHGVDALSVHGRTVRQMYRGEVDYGLIRLACRSVACPVLANGNITSARTAMAVQADTGCHGVMVGRSAIRNPWIFRQIRELSTGRPVFRPVLEDVRRYVDDLWQALAAPGLPEPFLLGRMKKFLNFVGLGVDPAGAFLHAMRHARGAAELFSICDAHLLAGGRAGSHFPDEPYPELVARPNAEAAPC